MLSTYRRLWAPSGEVSPGAAVGALLLVLSVALPISLSMTPYEPIIPLVTFGAIGAIVAAVLFFNIRHFAIFAFPAIYLTGQSHIILAASILVAVSYLAALVQSGRLSLRVPYPSLFLLLALFSLNALLRAVETGLAMYMLAYNVIAPAFAFLIFYNLRLSARDIRTHLSIISLLAAIIGWVSILLYLKTGLERKVFLWDSQNLGAAFLALILPFSLTSFIGARGASRKLLCGAIFLGISVGVVTSQTRAVLLSSLIAMLFIGWKDRNALKAVFPVLVLAMILAPTLILTRMVLLFGRGVEVDWSSVGRVQIWLNTLKLIPEYFFWGMGINGFKTIYAVRFPESFLKAVHPHNIYVHWMLEYGVIGLVAFLALVIGCLSRGWRAVNRFTGSRMNDASRALLGINAGILSILIAGMVDAYLRCPRVAVLFWCLMAFQLLLARELNQTQSTP